MTPSAKDDPAPPATPAAVACILVNYRSPWEMLAGCLDSIYASGGITVNVTLVDNASGDGVIDQVRQAYPAVNVSEAPDNAGFAAAVNRGLTAVTEPFVLLLNTDTQLAPDAVALMTDALSQSDSRIAGVAPKMLSSAHAGIIDAVGTVMPTWGAPFNRGIGQCDLGQYDISEPVAGVCFGAALLRRELFEPAAVGPLYEDYFLYFEDSDWCMRAAAMGYGFLTAPASVVLHLHSGITRMETLDFKYRLIELNTLKMVTRTFESPLRTAHIVTSRSLRLLARTFVRRRFIRANIATLTAYAGALPRLLRERRELKARRTTSDTAILNLSRNEHAYFDTVEYCPDRCLEALTDTYLKRLRQTSDPETGRLLAALYRLRPTGAGTIDPAVMDEARRLFADQPPCVRELLDAVTAGS
ncbi:MAG: glycosyltransferase family 2 protein [Thermoleophilia bacterium]